MGRIPLFVFCLALSLFSACATTSDKTYTLEQALEKNVAISIPIRVSDRGLIVLEDIKIDGHPVDMVLDTGATQSAIFEASLNRLDTKMLSYGETMVHGMMQSKQHDIVTLKKLEVGPLQFLTKPMVILDNRDLGFSDVVEYEGLIGMDVLANYKVYISPKAGELRLIPNRADVLIPYYWDKVELIENPFLDDNRSLHFIELRVDGRKTPALMDTGSEFSAMNWNSASYTQVKYIRRRLRKDWELQGASGTFEPVAKVKLKRVRSGQKFWENKDFIIMDFESLDILGAEDEPFIIVGMNLLAEETFVLDFENNILAIKPEQRGMFAPYKDNVYEINPR